MAKNEHKLKTMTASTFMSCTPRLVKLTAANNCTKSMEQSPNALLAWFGTMSFTNKTQPDITSTHNQKLCLHFLCMLYSMPQKHQCEITGPKAAHKIMFKLTPEVYFTNILAFSRIFFHLKIQNTSYELRKAAQKSCL